jgi:amidase
MPEPAAAPGARAPGGGAPGGGAAGPGVPGADPANGAGAAAGTPSSVARTTGYLDRIAELNPALGAVITVSPGALDEAAARDHERRDHERRDHEPPRGPLHGVPVLIKDNIDVRGMPATAGSPALGAAADRGDAFLVTRLREAGAVILGKANLSEWANFRSYRSTSGWSTLGGQAANPHALDRNPSGSSSGSGVAVAAGLAPMAVGTETDGSIVAPASACGVVGIKPTVGLVSRRGIVPISAAQDTAGPMTRTVAEAAALLGVLAGPDPGDLVTAAAEGRPADYTAFLDAGALAGARLGVWRDGCHEAGDTIMAVLGQALAVLRDLGATVLDPVELPGAAGIGDPEWLSLLHEFKRDINGYLRALPGHPPRSLAELIDFNIRNGPTVLAHFGQEIFLQAEATSGDPADPAAQAARAEATGRAREALDGPLAAHRLDAIVTLTNPAGLTDYVLGDNGVFHTSGPSAVAGYPAITVPAGQVSGLPVGLSFLGPAWSEPALIGLAYAFEQASQALSWPSLQATLPATVARSDSLRLWTPGVA